MTLPGINQLVNNVYQKNSMQLKNGQKNKQAGQDSTEKSASKNKNAYGESADYIRSKNSRQTEGAETDPISGTSQKVELSDKAKEYLEKLRSKYSNMDIMVNDGLTDEQVQRHLNRGNKEYSVMIDAETLEKMASDESVKAEYEGVLDNAGSIFQNMKDELGEDAKYVKSIGITIDSSGNTEYYSIIDKSLEKHPINGKKASDDDKKTTDSKKTSGTKKTADNKTKVSSSNLEEFIEKIKKAVAEIKDKAGKEQSGRFDASI